MLGAGATVAAAHTVFNTLSVQAPVQNAGLLTINGTLELAAGGSITGAPVYGSTSLLRYSAPRTIGQEWNSGITVGTGVPQNVEVAVAAGVLQQVSSLM